MSRQPMNGGPPCPSPETLAKVKDWLSGFEDATAIDALSCIDWLETFLDNRRLYHKKKTVKDRIVTQLLKDKLDHQEVLDVETQAEGMAALEVFNIVAERNPEDE